jgi:hypothetical protein
MVCGSLIPGFITWILLPSEPFSVAKLFVNSEFAIICFVFARAFMDLLFIDELAG